VRGDVLKAAVQRLQHWSLYIHGTCPGRSQNRAAARASQAGGGRP
jgi:hypothetical protein